MHLMYFDQQRHSLFRSAFYIPAISPFGCKTLHLYVETLIANKTPYKNV